MMHGHEESDSAIVAVKPTNKAERSAAEPVEPRRRPRGMRASKARAGLRAGKPCHRRWSAYGKSKAKKKERFTSLLHHISIELLDAAFFELKEDAAPGVDGLTWTDYELDLERNLAICMLASIGAYRALPSRRTFIPKPDGRQRPLAIAALEDKIVQRRLSRCSTRSTRKTSSVLVRIPTQARHA